MTFIITLKNLAHKKSKILKPLAYSVFKKYGLISVLCQDLVPVFVPNVIYENMFEIQHKSKEKNMKGRAKHVAAFDCLCHPRF